MNFITYEEKLLNKLISPNMEIVQITRLKFGLYLLLDGIKKGIMIYGIALLLGCFMETMLVHVSFLILRQVSFGWHSTNNLACVLWSILAFPILTFIWGKFYFNFSLLLAICIICCLIIWFSGPIGTQVNILSNLKHKQLLHFKLKRRILLIVFLSIIIPPSIYQYFILGIFIQTVTLLIQILKNGVTVND